MFKDESQVATCGQLLISDEPLEYLRWTGADRRWEASAGEEEEKAQETTACSIMYTGGGGGGGEEADLCASPSQSVSSIRGLFTILIHSHGSAGVAGLLS